MSRFRGACQSLNFDKEYLFGFETLVFATSGACTMMVDEQIQSYRISFELTKPNHSNLALLVP